jgi:hypothetical protein
MRVLQHRKLFLRAHVFVAKFTSKIGSRGQDCQKMTQQGQDNGMGQPWQYSGTGPFGQIAEQVKTGLPGHDSGFRRALDKGGWTE